jgi:hypothetical protein
MEPVDEVMNTLTSEVESAEGLGEHASELAADGQVGAFMAD